MLPENGIYDAETLSKRNETRYERKAVYSIEDIRLATKDVLFNPRKTDIILDGDIVKGNSQRYQLFFTKGMTCVCCGIKGKFFRKERTIADIDKMNPKRCHLNLYAVNDDGIEVLMTKDHIIPKSKGGKDTLDNYQTMCEICNKRKGNKLEE